jgi:hypothetical protein
MQVPKRPEKAESGEARQQQAGTEEEARLEETQEHRSSGNLGMHPVPVNTEDMKRNCKNCSKEGNLQLLLPNDASVSLPPSPKTAF